MGKFQYFKAFIKCIFLLSILFIMAVSCSKTNNKRVDGTIDVGVARVDITPETPIRLAGFAARTKVEADTVLQRLSAKAIAFGSDEQNPSILISVDLIGIQWRVTSELVDKLSKSLGIKPEQVVICATHSHGSPEIGNLINILQCRGDYPTDFGFSDSLLSSEELLHIAQFNELLSKRLESVAMEALKNRKPTLLTWGKETVTFAENRRTDGGPVDHSLPVLFVSDPDGTLRAVLMNYACHGISLGPDVNSIHGDWMGEAQKEIEARHPGAIAMVTIGYAGDSHPKLRDDIKYTKQYAQDIANSVDKLLQSKLQSITLPPVSKTRWIKLPFSHVPTVQELIELTEDKTVKGYYARLALERVIRGESLPTELDYLVQTWSFGDEMLMINLGGEPVVDYSVRLKNELDAQRLWLNGYANDVPCYIASKRVINEGGYEADASMYWYNMPSPLSEEVEELIMNTVHDLVPASFKK
ncbi:MAG: hypothetical protein ACOYEG_04325 [Petrimonas sp.]